MKVRTLALAVCALAALAGCGSTPEAEGPPPPPVQRSAGAWLFDYDAGSGVASSILRSGQGTLLFEISCEAPRGPIEFRDWTFTDLAAGPQAIVVRLGGAALDLAGTSPASMAARNGLGFAIAPDDPAVNQLFAGQSVIVMTPTGHHQLDTGAAEQIVAVANACYQRGS